MILYLGDDNMAGAAAYLSGVMLHGNIPFERVDGNAAPPEDFGSNKYDSYVLSDYPAKNFKPGQLDKLRGAVAQGAGLLMIGGWESFGVGGYGETVLTELLPVKMANQDDRRNFSQPIMAFKHHNHPLMEGLPWDRPPFVGGLNQLEAKPEATILLKALRTKIRIVDEDEVADASDDSLYDFKARPFEDRLSIPLLGGTAALLSLVEDIPLLVVGKYGKGKTAAFASDVAPHWVGGMLDWGRNRVTQQLPGGDSIEVGEDYAKFFTQLLRWLRAE